MQMGYQCQSVGRDGTKVQAMCSTLYYHQQCRRQVTSESLAYQFGLAKEFEWGRMPFPTRRRLFQLAALFSQLTLFGHGLLKSMLICTPSGCTVEFRTCHEALDGGDKIMATTNTSSQHDTSIIETVRCGLLPGYPTELTVGTTSVRMHGSSEGKLVRDA